MNEIDEAELISAGERGAVVDGALNGVKRVVQAASLRKCCHELKGQIDPRGLRLNNSLIVGTLDLAGLDVPFPLRFDGCEFDSALVVEGAQLYELSLTGCPRLPGLLGNGLRVRRDLDLSRSRVGGAHWTTASTSMRAAIWLCESEIGGRLLCVDAAIDGQGDRAVHADRMIAGAVRLVHQFRALGEVRMKGARLGGSLDLTGAHIYSPAGPAVDLEDATIDGSMFLIEDSAGRRPVIQGRFALGSARISGRLAIRNATLQAAPDRPAASSIYATPGTAGVALSAARLTVGSDAVLAHCDVTGSIDMPMSDMSSLSISENCVLRSPGRRALDLTNAEIRSSLRLDEDSVVEGTLRLTGAVIHGSLELHGQMSHPEKHISVVRGNPVTVDGDVWLEGLRTDDGGVNFRAATLGSLNAGGAHLHNPGGYALRLSQAVIKGPVRLVNGFTSTGLVALNRASIEGRLQLTGGSFTCPAPAPRNKHGHAIEAISATVRSGMDLGWAHVSPSVDFTDATTSFLADDPAAWPERYTIAGLTYERFDTPQGRQPKPIWDQTARCAWLRRQATLDSGPYEQAARVYRQHGYSREAEQILIAQRKDARQIGGPGTTWPRRAIEAIYATVGYGYRPSRVLWLLAALLVLVAASLELPASQATLRATNGNGDVYATSGLLTTSAGPLTQNSNQQGTSLRTDPCGDGEVRCFSPVLYAIDTVVPLITLDQRSTWYPDPNAPGGELMLWWLNFATLLGWLLSSIFVLSLTRLSRSS
jgi:hypothetical protein